MWRHRDQNVKAYFRYMLSLRKLTIENFSKTNKQKLQLQYLQQKSLLGFSSSFTPTFYLEISPKLSGLNPTDIYLVPYFSLSSLEHLTSTSSKDWPLRLSSYLYSSLFPLCSVCLKHCWQWAYLLGNVKGLNFLILPLASQAPA